MSWRPDNWPEIKAKVMEQTYYNPLNESGLIEAGADAMLEVRRPIDLMILGTLDCMIEGPATPIHHLKRVRYELEKVMGELHKGTEKDMQMLEEQP